MGAKSGSIDYKIIGETSRKVMNKESGSLLRKFSLPSLPTAARRVTTVSVPLTTLQLCHTARRLEPDDVYEHIRLISNQVKWERCSVIRVTPTAALSDQDPSVE